MVDSSEIDPQPLAVPLVSTHEGARLGSADAAEHIIMAIAKGRADLLSPKVMEEMEDSKGICGVQVGLEVQGVLGTNWSFAGFNFLGATATYVGVPVLAAPLAAGAALAAAPATVAALPVTGAMMGASWVASAAGIAKDMYAGVEERPELPPEQAFVLRYGIASKSQLRCGLIPVVVSFWDLRPGDTVLELALKRGFNRTGESVEAVLHALMQAYPSAQDGKKALQRAMERAGEAMGQANDYVSLAAAKRVLDGASPEAAQFSFAGKNCPIVSWVQLEHFRSAQVHTLEVCETGGEESRALVTQMLEASELRLKKIDVQLPADAAFSGFAKYIASSGQPCPVRFWIYFLEATVKDASGDGSATRQLYFTFGADSSIFEGGSVVAKASTEEPEGSGYRSYEVDKYPRSSAMAKRMLEVCGATNFSLILRNSEHMMRYIVGGTWHSPQTHDPSPFFKGVVIKEFAPQLRASFGGSTKDPKSASLRSKLQDTIRSHLNELPFEKKDAATRRAVYCEKGCPACEKEDAASDDDFEKKEGHVPLPALFDFKGVKSLKDLAPEDMQDDINIVLVGPTGCGKSHLLNVLFNSDVSASSSSSRSVTADILFFQGTLNKAHPLVTKYGVPLRDRDADHLLSPLHRFNLIDTIGFCDTKKDPTEVINLIKSKLNNAGISLHKILVVTAAGQRTQKDHIEPINSVMKWLDYAKNKRNFVFVYNKCDGLKRDERERNQAEVLEDLGVSREESNESQVIHDPDASETKKMLISSAIAVGFPPSHKSMEKDAEKSLRLLALAILYWKKHDSKPVPLSAPSVASCLRMLTRD